MCWVVGCFNKVRNNTLQTYSAKQKPQIYCRCLYGTMPGRSVDAVHGHGEGHVGDLLHPHLHQLLPQGLKTISQLLLPSQLQGEHGRILQLVVFFLRTNRLCYYHCHTPCLSNYLCSCMCFSCIYFSSRIVWKL